MLQREQEKANKKIKDTSKKTDELIERKEHNDNQYQNVITEQDRREQDKRQLAESNFVREK